MLTYSVPTCYFTKVGGYRVHDVKELTLDEYINVWNGWGYCFYNADTGKVYKRPPLIADFWTLNPYRWLLLGISFLSALALIAFIVLAVTKAESYVAFIALPLAFGTLPWPISALFMVRRDSSIALRYDATASALPQTKIVYDGGYDIFVHVPFDHPQAAKYINANPEVSVGEGEYIFMAHASGRAPRKYSSQRMASEEVYERYLASRV